MQEFTPEYKQVYKLYTLACKLGLFELWRKNNYPHSLNCISIVESWYCLARNIAHNRLLSPLVVQYLEHAWQLRHHLNEMDVPVLVEVAHFCQILNFCLVQLETKVARAQKLDEIFCGNVTGPSHVASASGQNKVKVQLQSLWTATMHPGDKPFGLCWEAAIGISSEVKNALAHFGP